MRLIAVILVFGVLTAASGCRSAAYYNKIDIVKVTDFKLSPDEEKIAFSAITPVGNTDIWVVDTDGSNLKKLTFKDYSISNRIARFFKRHKLGNYFEVDMCSPEWTEGGRIIFCQKLSRRALWDSRVINLKYWTIKPDGTDKRPYIKPHESTPEELPVAINTFKAFEFSGKHQKKIFLDSGRLWYLEQDTTGLLIR